MDCGFHLNRKALGAVAAQHLAHAQLRVSSRRLAEAEGGGIEVTFDNAGPLAVTRIALVLTSAGQPVATLEGRAVLASERTPLRFTPEIVNEYNEKILGLPR